MILLVLAGAGILLTDRFAQPGMIAEIALDGEPYRTINLRAVTLPYEFEVETELGRNIVRVEQGRIAVVEADCPDQICVQRGYASETGLPIVCLPHRLSIQLEEER